MRFLRYLMIIIFILTLIVAAVGGNILGAQHPAVIISTVVAAIIGLVSTVEWLWDKVGPARGIGDDNKQPTSSGTIEDYLNGRLRAFADEEKRFIPLALTLKPAYQEGDAEPSDEIEAIFQQNNGRFILLGDPGAGKSTTLRHLMRQAINNYLRYPKNNRIPIWINLGEGDNPIQPEVLLKHWWEKRCYLPGTPEQHIRQHNLLVFLDGLNEMPLDSRSERAKLLRDFLEKTPEIQVIVTCRIRDYEDDKSLNLSQPVVNVLPLDDKRIQDFILRNGGDANLWNIIYPDDALRALAANPYNLYQLIQISREPDGQNLPRDLNPLYSRYLKVTYNRYTRERTRKRDKETPLLKLPLPSLQKRLERLAFAMLAGGKGTSADLAWTLHWGRRWRWGQQAVRDGLNLGVLLGDGQSLRFYHQSLHGYFAIEPLSRALTISGGFDRFTKNPSALIRQIGDLGAAGAPAIDPLLVAIKDREVYIRNSAAYALGKIGDAAVEPLIEMLNNKGGIMEGIIDALGNIGLPAVDPLLAILNNRDANIRANAALALGATRNSRTFEQLIALLGDEESVVQDSAAQALGKIGNIVIEPLIGALSDTNNNVSSHAAEVLGKINDIFIIEPLIEALANENENIREYAVKLLGKTHNKGAVKSLVNMLNDKSKNVCRNAVVALGEIGDERAVEPLIGLINDSSIEIRQCVALALGRIGDERAVGPLTQALNDISLDVCRNAAAGLYSIGTVEARAIQAKWRQEKITIKQPNSSPSPAAPPIESPNTE